MIHGLFIPDPDPDFLPITDPGIKKAADPGSATLSATLEISGPTTFANNRFEI